MLSVLRNNVIHDSKEAGVFLFGPDTCALIENNCKPQPHALARIHTHVPITHTLPEPIVQMNTAL